MANNSKTADKVVQNITPEDQHALDLQTINDYNQELRDKGLPKKVQAALDEQKRILDDYQNDVNNKLPKNVKEAQERIKIHNANIRKGQIAMGRRISQYIVGMKDENIADFGQDVLTSGLAMKYFPDIAKHFQQQ